MMLKITGNASLQSVMSSCTGAPRARAVRIVAKPELEFAAPAGI